MYGWAQSLDGDLAVGGVSVPVDVPFSDLLADLDMAFMGALEIGRDRWSVLLDLNYANLSASMLTPAGIVAPAVCS